MTPINSDMSTVGSIFSWGETKAFFVLVVDEDFVSTWWMSPTKEPSLRERGSFFFYYVSFNDLINSVSSVTKDVAFTEMTIVQSISKCLFRTPTDHSDSQNNLLERRRKPFFTTARNEMFEEYVTLYL